MFSQSSHTPRCIIRVYTYDCVVTNSITHFIRAIDEPKDPTFAIGYSEFDDPIFVQSRVSESRRLSRQYDQSQINTKNVQCNTFVEELRQEPV